MRFFLTQDSSPIFLIMQLSNLNFVRLEVNRIKIDKQYRFVGKANAFVIEFF